MQAQRSSKTCYENRTGESLRIRIRKIRNRACLQACRIQHSCKPVLAAAANAKPQRLKPLSCDAPFTASLKRGPDTNLFSAVSLPGFSGGRG
jgi:hypothetical protein